MPADLTGTSIADSYTSFLHLSTDTLGSTIEPVFDGLGNRSSLRLSTKGVTLSGDININEIGFPDNKGDENQILKIDADGNVVYADLFDEWTRESGFTLLDDGIFSKPNITVTNGFITALVDNPTINTFFIRKDNPAPSNYISVVTSNWPNPVINDVAFVHNLATGAAFKLYYTGAGTTGWEISVTI